MARYIYYKLLFSCIDYTYEPVCHWKNDAYRNKPRKNLACYFSLNLGGMAPHTTGQTLVFKRKFNHCSLSVSAYAPFRGRNIFYPGPVRNANINSTGERAPERIKKK